MLHQYWFHSVGQEVAWSGSRMEPGEEVSSKRRFTEMSHPSHWIDLHDVRQLSSKLKAKLMGKRNVVSENVVVPKANVSVEIIIVSDDDGDGDDITTALPSTMTCICFTELTVLEVAVFQNYSM
ncbi:hypothetical protein Tco_0421141 [Tanacetum coccineum]